MIRSSVYMKAVAVINSCTTHNQRSGALRFMVLAWRGGHINDKQWNELFNRVNITYSISVDLAKRGAEQTAVNGRIIEEDDYNG